MFEALVMEDYSEKVDYYNRNFPVKTWKTNNTNFRTLAYVNHWHCEYEFVYIVSGTMKYNINNKVIELKKGDLLFVNSCNMHFGFQDIFSECEVICLMFHPSVIDNRLSNKPLPSYLLLNEQNISDIEAINCIKAIFKYDNKDDLASQFGILSWLYKLCGEIAEHSKDMPPEPESKEVGIMQRMTGFIQKKYPEKIKIEDIAEAGMVCRSKCCKIFKEFLGKTPIEYLTEYRINKSIGLLKTTDMSITEIAVSCGFCGSSYFTETFVKMMKCTPSGFRKI